jgi:aspartate-semialdehyde dehydrogenase
MSDKLKAGIIGATGMVGQNYIKLLHNHPWFEVTYLAASPRSAGKKYRAAVAGRWQMPVEIPEAVKDIVVRDASNVEDAVGECSLIFSAVDMEKQAVAALESEYASRGFAVVSNNSAHRHTDNVPVLIPEINAAHIEIIPEQRKRYGWDKGLIAVKPNCSIQSYMLPLYALLEAGYPVDKMVVATLQALSGAGYPGPSAMDMIDNVVPYISGEEEKSEIEPAKILGKIQDGRFVPDESIRISAHCNRVPVIDGHIACVSLHFSNQKPDVEEIIKIWQGFRSVPQELELPSAPLRPLIYRPEIDRPQPRKDRDADRGMAVSVGRLRPCNVFDYRFVGLHHNTIRGAAGGSILIAELLKAKGYIT